SFLIVLLAMLGLAGCRSLPDVELGPCEELDTTRFAEAFNFKTASTMRYRYWFRRKNAEFTCNGITQQKGDSIYIAGFSNAGITLFSALWENGQFTVLRNNTKIPESFLSKSVLNDLLIVYRRPSDNDCCVRRNRLDDSLWLEMEDQLAGTTGYFVINHDNPAWIGVKNDTIYYRATIANKRELDCLDIESYKEGYHSEIRLLDTPGGRGSLEAGI
ncbi:MAG: DUF3261 domain-containing protein, partial [Planctomycetota bacterium]